MIALLSLSFVLSLQVAQASQKPTLPVTSQAETPVQGPYEFISDVGAFVIVVKADKASAFDAAMGRLRRDFQATTDKDRKAQGAGWRVLKSTEKPSDDGTLLYIWLIDPVAKSTSYDPIEIIRQIAPDDVQPVYDQLSAAIVSITRVGLKDLVKMGGS